MKNPISLRLLSLLTRIAYWGLIVLTSIVVFAGVIMITLEPQEMKLGLPFDLTTSKNVVFLESDPGTPVEVPLSADTIEVYVKHLDTPTICYLLFVTLLWLTCMIFIARYFKIFMDRVLTGNTFQSETIALLKKAAYGFVILEFVEFISSIIGHLYVLQKFDLGDVSHEFSWSFPSFNLVLALTLWALAHIFQKGKELADEQKLTV